MGGHNSRPVSINQQHNLFLRSKYDYLFDTCPNSETQSSTESSFQQVLHTNSEEDRLRSKLRHEFWNCKAQDIYSYSLDLMSKPEEWEEFMECESYVIKTRYGSIFSEDLVALVYLDFKCCVSSCNILQVLFESSLRNKWDNTVDRFSILSNEKPNEFSIHLVNKLPIVNTEMLSKVVYNETLDETVIVMYSLNQQNFSKSSTVKVELYFSVMKILEQRDSTLMSLVIQIDDKLPLDSNATKLKLAYLSQWIAKFSKTAVEYERDEKIL